MEGYIKNLERHEDELKKRVAQLEADRIHFINRNGALLAENAKLREAAQAVVDDANIEPDTGWELPSYCHVERSEILALAALLEGE